MKGIFILIWNITKFTMVAIFPRGNKFFTISLVGWTVFNTVACFSWYILMISHSLSWFELSHGWLAIYSFCRCSWSGHNTISLYCTGIKPETVRTLCSESSACISHALLFICAKIQVKYVHLWVYNMCLSLYELYNPWTAIKRQSPYCRSLKMCYIWYVDGMVCTHQLPV